MTAPTRLDHIHAQAEQLPQDQRARIAQVPGFYATPDATDRASKFGLYVPNVVDWAADVSGVDPDKLKSMAVLVEPRTIKEGRKGSLSFSPEEIGGKVHYPVIRLGVGKRTGANALNNTLRHELRHAFQPNRDPLDENRAAIRTLQVLGGVAAAGLGIAAYRTGNLAPSMLTGPAALLPIPYFAKTALWVGAPQELDAELFSRRHRSYKPIKDLS